VGVARCYHLDRSCSPFWQTTPPWPVTPALELTRIPFCRFAPRATSNATLQAARARAASAWLHLFYCSNLLDNEPPRIIYLGCVCFHFGELALFCDYFYFFYFIFTFALGLDSNLLGYGPVGKTLDLGQRSWRGKIQHSKRRRAMAREAIANTLDTIIHMSSIYE
jgi:hypothetical protein